MTNDRLWQKTIDPSTTAFFLDVDGTLLGFKERPEDVVADDELLQTLRNLRQAANDAVAFVSGRALADLDRIASPLVLPAGAVHGADIRFADGRHEVLAADALDELRTEATAFVAARPGLRLEDKGATIALHFRAKPDLEHEVMAFLKDRISGDDLMIQPGKMVAEVKSSRSHKGKAIETLMATPPFAGRQPLFIGDDLTDEHGFATVNTMHGVSIKVGPASEPTVALHRLEDPSAVLNFLSVICRSDGKTPNKAVS